MNTPPIKVNDEVVSFSVVQGAILSTRKYLGSVQHTYSASLRTLQEVWLETDDGREISLQISDTLVPLRKGQRVSVVSASVAHSDSEVPALLVNHNAKTSSRIRPVSDLAATLGVAKEPGVTVMLILAVPLVIGLGALTTGAEWAAPVVILSLPPLFLSWLFFLGGSALQARKARNALEPELKRIEDQLMCY